MINILVEKHKFMKEKASLEKDAALIVLNEIRTIEMLERGEITSKMQYKWFEKMLATRLTSLNIYKQQNRMDLYEKEKAEADIIKHYLNELSNDMPKQLTEDEIKSILLKYKNEHLNYTISDIMKFFSKAYPEQNKAIVAKIFNTIK